MAMNLSLSKLPWYGQLGAFAALSLAGAGIFWNFYAKPVQETITAREAQLAAVQARIQRGLQTARRLPQFRRPGTGLQAQLARLRPVLPRQEKAAQLLRRLHGM